MLLYLRINSPTYFLGLHILDLEHFKVIGDLVFLHIFYMISGKNEFRPKSAVIYSGQTSGGPGADHCCLHNPH